MHESDSLKSRLILILLFKSKSYSKHMVLFYQNTSVFKLILLFPDEPSKNTFAPNHKDTKLDPRSQPNQSPFKPKLFM